MTAPALLIPRPEIDVLDKNGKMDRNWYKYLALIGKSVGPSTTSNDDIQLRDILGAIPEVPTQQQIGQQLYPQTDGERAAGVGPANYAYAATPILDPNRYGGYGANTITGDWFTDWQLSIGIPVGSVNGAVGTILTNASQDKTVSPLGLICATHTIGLTSAGQNAVAGEDYAINDNALYANSVWGRYIEAHRFNNVVNTATGLELDVTQRGAQVGINPYIQNFGATVPLQLASGAQEGVLATASFATNVMTITLVNLPADNGLIQAGWRVKGAGVDTTISSFGTGVGAEGTYNLSSSVGTITSRIVAVSPMFDNTAAINIQANPNSFTAGICFGYNSITGSDGVNGTVAAAIQMARLQGIFWFSASTIGTAQFYCDATATIGSPQIQLGQAAVNFSEVSSGGRNFQIGMVTNSVNYTFAEGGIAGSNAATLGALGGDTDVDLGIFCAGAGVMKFVNASHFVANGAVAMSLGSTGPTGANATPSKWLVIKDGFGSKFAVAAYSIP